MTEEKQIEQQLEKTVEKMVAESVEHAVEQAVEDSVKESVEQVVEDSVKESVEQAVEDSVKESVEQAAEEEEEEEQEPEEEEPEEEEQPEEEEDEDDKEEINPCVQMLCEKVAQHNKTYLPVSGIWHTKADPPSYVEWWPVMSCEYFSSKPENVERVLPDPFEQWVHYDEDSMQKFVGVSLVLTMLFGPSVFASVPALTVLSPLYGIASMLAWDKVAHASAGPLSVRPSLQCVHFLLFAKHHQYPQDKRYAAWPVWLFCLASLCGLGPLLMVFGVKWGVLLFASVVTGHYAGIVVHRRIHDHRSMQFPSWMPSEAQSTYKSFQADHMLGHGLERSGKKED